MTLLGCMGTGVLPWWSVVSDGRCSPRSGVPGTSTGSCARVLAGGLLSPWHWEPPGDPRQVLRSFPGNKTDTTVDVGSLAVPGGWESSIKVMAGPRSL